MRTHTRLHHCPICNWQYVLVGGQRQHVCPAKHYVDPRAGQASAAGKGMRARKKGQKA